MTADSQPLPRAWLIVVLLWFTVLFNYVARLLPTTMHGSIVSAMPMTETQFGLLTSCLFWAYGLMSPFAGYMADRFSRSRVIIMSMFLWSAITWLTSYARTFEQLVILRTLVGVSEACYFPAALALISDYHRGPTRSLATGIHQSGFAIGIALSGFGGWLAEQRSWHYAFSLVGLVGIAHSAVLAFLLRDAPRLSRSGTPSVEAKPPVRFGEALVNLFGRTSFVLAFINMALLGVTGWTVIAWLPVFMQEHFHLTQGLAGFSANGYMNAAAVPGFLIGGAWADRWSRTNRRARMFVPAIGLLVASPGILLAANNGVFILAIMGLVTFSVFESFFGANMMPILCEVVDSRYRATGYGLINLMGTIAAGFGIYFSGVLRDGKIDLHIVFDIVAAVYAICALLLYFIRDNKLIDIAPAAAVADPLRAE